MHIEALFMYDLSQQIERAEVKMSLLLAQHNVPLALADHLSPLIRDVFDGEVAKGYACAKTKTKTMHTESSCSTTP